MPTILDRLLGRTQREQKATTNYRSGTYYSDLPQAVWTPHDYGRIAKEGYQHNIWVYTCIREITNAAKNTPIILYETQGNGDKVELTQHPMLDLLRKPHGDNPTHPVSWEGFLEATIAYLLISGNYYIYKQKPESRNAPPLRLYTLRPDLTTMHSDGSHTYGAGITEKRFPAGEVLHGTLFHPLNDTYGLGVIEAASRGIDMFNAGMAHNVKLLQNGARPASAWISEGDLTDEQFERMRSQMMRYEGPNNAGKQLLLEGGIKWQDLSLTPHEMDWLNGIDNAARQIHAAFGVHPVLTGLQEGTFENQRMAMRGLYTNAVLPLLQHVLADLTAFLRVDYGDNLTLKINRDGIEALSEDQDSLYERITTAFTSGVLTRNEAREALGYDEVPDGETFYTPTGTLNDATPIETKSEEDELYYKRFDAELTRREDRAERNIKSALRQQRARLLDALDNATPSTLADIVNRVYDNLELRETLTDEILSAMIEEGRDTVATLKNIGPSEIKEFEDVFGIYSEEALREAERRAGDAVVQTTSTQRNLINMVAREAIVEGLSIPDVTRRIDEIALQQIYANRSRAIARTEIVGASNRGKYYAAKGTGLKLTKKWLATPFGDFREDHVAVNGMEIPLDDEYDVGGVRMLHPHSPGAPADQVVNCRCTYRTVVQRA